MGQTTTTSGNIANGMVVNQDQSTLTIAPSTTVSGGQNPAILVNIPANSTFSPRSATINVGGSVNGAGQNGIEVTSGDFTGQNYDPYGTKVAINIGAGGSVSGAAGISASPFVPATPGPSVVVLDNAGTIVGAAGAALVSSGLQSGFVRLTNEASGRIGGIAAAVQALNNDGTIDGGTGAAIALRQDIFFNDASIANTGIIAASGGAATITSDASTAYFFCGLINNSGMITNLGTGAAISGAAASGALTVVNAAGGVIEAAGASALSLTRASTIDNAGMISSGGGQPAIAGEIVSVQITPAGSFLAAVPQQSLRQPVSCSPISAQSVAMSSSAPA